MRTLDNVPIDELVLMKSDRVNDFTTTTTTKNNQIRCIVYLTVASFRNDCGTFADALHCRASVACNDNVDNAVNEHNDDHNNDNDDDDDGGDECVVVGVE